MSILLGLDPSPLRIGWAYVDLETGAPARCGTQMFAKTDDGLLCPRSVRDALRAIDLYTLDDIAVVYVETGFIGPNRRGSAHHMEALGQCVQAASRRWTRAVIQRIAPAEWRKACGLKGNTPKTDVMEAARARALEESPTGYIAAQLIAELQEHGQDAADALMIATAGWTINQRIITGQNTA